MSRQAIVNHYTRLLARWPQDALRREKKFQSVLESRTRNPPVPFRDEEKEVNAGYLLLENSFSKQYPPGEKLMRPDSNPEHYEALKQELHELPNRSPWETWLKRMKNMVRFK